MVLTLDYGSRGLGSSSGRSHWSIVLNLSSKLSLSHLYLIVLYPTVTSENVFWGIRNVNSLIKVFFTTCVVTAVWILILLKLKWPKSQSLYTFFSPCLSPRRCINGYWEFNAARYNQIQRGVKVLLGTKINLEESLDKKINVLFVTDHAQHAQYVFRPSDPLRYYINPSTYTLTESGSIGHMWQKEGKLGEIYKNLTKPKTPGYLRIITRSTIDESRRFSSIPTLAGLWPRTPI